MAFNDKYRLSVHAVITDHTNKILQLKATYTNKNWGLPGGAIDPGETIHKALSRECLEELGCKIEIKYLSGVYYHEFFNSHAFIFRCEFIDNTKITLSDEHSDYKYFEISELSAVQKIRINDCLNFDGVIKSKSF